MKLLIGGEIKDGGRVPDGQSHVSDVMQMSDSEFEMHVALF